MCSYGSIAGCSQPRRATRSRSSRRVRACTHADTAAPGPARGGQEPGLKGLLNPIICASCWRCGRGWPSFPGGQSRSVSGGGGCRAALRAWTRGAAALCALLPLPQAEGLPLGPGPEGRSGSVVKLGDGARPARRVGSAEGRLVRCSVTRQRMGGMPAASVPRACSRGRCSTCPCRGGPPWGQAPGIPSGDP